MFEKVKIVKTLIAYQLFILTEFVSVSKSDYLDGML
jgi:hypothetical protein